MFDASKLLEQHEKINELQKAIESGKEQMGALSENFERTKATVGRLQVELMAEQRVLEIMTPEPKEPKDGTNLP